MIYQLIRVSKKGPSNQVKINFVLNKNPHIFRTMLFSCATFSYNLFFPLFKGLIIFFNAIIFHPVCTCCLKTVQQCNNVFLNIVPTWISNHLCVCLIYYNTCVNSPSLHPCLCYSTLDYLSLCPGQRRGFLIGKSLFLSVFQHEHPSALDMPMQGGTTLPDSLLRGKGQSLNLALLRMHCSRLTLMFMH